MPRRVDARPSRPLSVLVVEDDADSRRLLTAAVARLGHTCVSASNGKEAWTILQHGNVDAVLCDLAMPEMGGLELCRLVRGRRGAPYVYFVLMTAFSDKEHYFEGMRAGADGYFTKPYELRDLEVWLLSATRVIELQRRFSRQAAALAQRSERSFRTARVDPLTDSANRLRLREDLEALQSRVARYGHRYCAALCDVDFFKSYNDANGHIAGDAALRRIAGAMGAQIRRGDTLYRYGGEEFLVILPGQDLTEASSVMERVRHAVSALRLARPGPPPGVLTISVGIAELRDRGETCDDWLRRADAALYAAKHAGRDRVEVDRTVPPRAD